MYKLEVTRRFERDFIKLSKPVQDQIIRRVSALVNNPYSEKRLHGPLKGYLSLRWGDYRVIFSVDGRRKAVVLEHCGHRKKIYDKVK